MIHLGMWFGYLKGLVMGLKKCRNRVWGMIRLGSLVYVLINLASQGSGLGVDLFMSLVWALINFGGLINLGGLS